MIYIIDLLGVSFLGGIVAGLIVKAIECPGEEWDELYDELYEED